MDVTIHIATQVGKDLRTRSFFRRDIEALIAQDYNIDTLDFDGVEFVSRSVADELCEILVDHPNLKTTGMDGQVKTMYEIVVRGRQRPRVYQRVTAKVVHLESYKDMEIFFSSF